MLIVTGGIACGKSCLKKHVETKHGKSAVDADDWYKIAKSSLAFRDKFRELFGKSSVDEVAFVHAGWEGYEYFVHHRFTADFLRNFSYDIVIIPEFFKFQSFYDKFEYDVLTIERSVNIEHVVKRDYFRDKGLSKRIMENQTSSSERLSKSKYSIWNDGTMLEFEIKIDDFMRGYYD